MLFPLAAPHIALPLIFFPLSSTNCCIHTRNDCCNTKKKDRVTLGLCTNISGKERLKLVFIHKSTHPRCFPRNFDPNRTVHYYCKKSTWMNGDVFTHWVKSENQRMALKDRKICIIMDNAGSHDIHGEVNKVIVGFNAFVLSHTRGVYFSLKPRITCVHVPY